LLPCLSYVPLRRSRGSYAAVIDSLSIGLPIASP
jgi:hypothetical protein